MYIYGDPRPAFKPFPDMPVGNPVMEDVRGRPGNAPDVSYGNSPSHRRSASRALSSVRNFPDLP